MVLNSARSVPVVDSFLASLSSDCFTSSRLVVAFVLISSTSPTAVFSVATPVFSSAAALATDVEIWESVGLMFVEKSVETPLTACFASAAKALICLLCSSTLPFFEVTSAAAFFRDVARLSCMVIAVSSCDRIASNLGLLLSGICGSSAASVLRIVRYCSA